MKKRFLSFLLTAIMILTMMPVKAEAGGASSDWGKLNDALKGGAQSTVANVFEVDDSLSGVRKIKLLANITAVSGDTTLIVGTGKQIIFDLNGFAIIGKINDSTSVGSVLKVPSGAKLTLEDNSAGKTGKITGGNAAFGGGVDVSTGDGDKRTAGGTFIMKGGTITGNKGGEYDGGGGVYVNGGVFSMSGNSVISDNSGNYGGGVYVENAEFVMSENSKIVNNNATKYGGGLCSEGINATVSINGGSIEGNTSYIAGGASINNGTFSMYGGSICNNAATSAIGNNGGGLYVGVNITLGGTAKIAGNTVCGKSNNVFLMRNKTIAINTPDSAMNIGLSMLEPGAFTSNTADGYLSYFSSDDSNYKVIYDTDKKLKLAKKYNVIIDSAITNGTVTTDAADGKAFEGDKVTVTATSSSGYILNSLKYNDGTEDHDITTTKSFTMPSRDVTITAEFEEKPHDFIITATSDKSVYDEGETIKITGTLKDGTTPVNNEAVTAFITETKKYDLITNEDGSFNVDINGLLAGKYLIRVWYEKDKYEDEVIVTVKEQNPEPDIMVTASSDKDTYLEGESILVSATVLDGNTPVNNEVVVFSANGREYKLTTINGSCSVSIDLPAGSYIISACYEKDGDEYKDEVEVTVKEQPNENHIVKFDLNNGKTDGPAPQEIKHGEKATKPADPSDEGWIFEGWYSDAELTTEYDFSAPIMADIKLFAKWTEEGLPTPPDPDPEPKPVEVYYAPLVADLKANEEGVIEWKAGDSLPIEAVKLLVDKPELSLEFTFTYEGEEHTIFIPAGAFEKYYDVTIPWYGPAWLIQYFEKAEKEVIEYTIVSGDTLNALAEKYKCTVEEILVLNPYVTNRNKIYPNNKLLIPVQR